MSQAHLTSEEIDLVLIGEDLAEGPAAHLAGCVTCRRGCDELAAAIDGARLDDPDELSLARARRAALSVPVRQRPRARLWFAAAAALVLVTLVAIFVVPALRPPAPKLDADAVLLDVDRVLARDPLAAMADETVVDAVVADATTAEAGTS